MLGKREERAAQVAELIAQGRSQRDVADLTGVPRRSVRDILAILGPEINELRDLNRDAMLASWQDTYFRTYRDLRQGDESGELKPGDRRNLAITMGIATEKVSLLAGIPTAIVASVHEVRVSLPDLANRLASVARVIGESDRSGRSDRNSSLGSLARTKSLVAGETELMPPQGDPGPQPVVLDADPT